MTIDHKWKYEKPIVRSLNELTTAFGEPQACVTGGYAGHSECTNGSSYIDCSGGTQVHTFNCTSGRGALDSCAGGNEEVGCGAGSLEDAPDCNFGFEVIGG